MTKHIWAGDVFHLFIAKKLVTVFLINLPTY